jgi:MFS superfamily sulfate permease-like transporter
VALHILFLQQVIKGMLAGIGIILIAKQIPLMLGYDEASFWTKNCLISSH